MCRWLQMVKMMITVVVIYALCWLPLHSVTLAGDTNPAVWSYRHIQIVWIASHWLAMSNCCYNPFVYFWMSTNFRSAFQRLGGRVLCRRRDDGGAAVAVQAQTLEGAGRRSPADRLHAAVRDTDSEHRFSTMSPAMRSLSPVARPRT